MREQLAQRDELIAQLLQCVQALEEPLSKESHNSSLPPSSDRFGRQKKARSLCRSSGKQAGGQEGHPGSTLQMSRTPDEVSALSSMIRCEQCQADLAAIVASHLERRQVIDVPLPRLQVTKYQGECKRCPHCHSSTGAAFPPGISAPVQYGPWVGAIGVYLVTQQLLSWSRSCEVAWGARQ